MKRVFALGILVGIGSLSILLSAFQAPPPAAVAATKIEKVKDNLYIITGSGAENQATFSGGNVAVFITDAGVTLVDTKLPGIRADDPRADQDGHQQAGDAHHQHAHARRPHRQQRLLRRLRREHRPREHQGEHVEDAGVQRRQRQFLPKRTYKDKLTVGSGKDQIDLYYFGRGHTNGDTFVVFPALRTMHVGDMFAWKALPYVDPATAAASSSSRTRWPRPRPCPTWTRSSTGTSRSGPLAI